MKKAALRTAELNAIMESQGTDIDKFLEKLRNNPNMYRKALYVPMNELTQRDFLILRVMALATALQFEK